MPSYFEARGVNPENYDNYFIPKYIIEELPKNKNAKILDIGCGFGQMIRKTKELGYTDISGIDINKNSVEYCKSVNLNVSLISDLQTFLDSSNVKYDMIIMSHIIEHLKKEEIIPILESMYTNALADNGQVIVLTPNAQAAIGAYWLHEDFTHNVILTPGSLYYVLYMAGFKDIRFLDIYATSNLCLINKIIRTAVIKIYGFCIAVRNMLLSNCYGKKPYIYTWEMRAIAKKQ